MADLFTRTEVDFGGAMTAQFGIVQAAGFDNFGLLLQNVQLQYSQQITRLYELGRLGAKMHVYYLSGRAQGQFTANRVVGPGVSMVGFYTKYGDVCKARDNTLDLNLQPNTCEGGGANVHYTCTYCVLVNVGVAASAQDFIINESATIQFAGMSVE